MYLDNKNPLATYEKQIEIKDRKLIVAETIKEMRKAKGYTQKQVADCIGVPQTTYSGYEQAKNETPAEILVRLSFLYDVPVDFLIGRDRFYITTGEDLQKQINEMNATLDQMAQGLANGEFAHNQETRMFADNLLTTMKQLTKAMEERNALQSKIKK